MNLFTPVLSSNHPRCLSLLQSCTSMTQFLQIHAQMIRNHLFCQDPFAACQVLEFCVSYPQGANLHYARKVFDQLPRTNTFAWNTLIRGYANSPFPQPCFRIFNTMLESGTRPNSHTYPFVLKACAHLCALSEGEQLHGLMIRLGGDHDIFSINGLVHMYGTCGKIDAGRQLFETSSERDIVTWNSLICGYGNCGSLDRARQLFDEMPEKGPVTWNAMINGYAKCGDIDAARELFNTMPGRNVESWNTLVAGYAKCGLLDMSRKLFDEMPARNIVSWSAMITAYAQGDKPGEALSLFEEMKSLNLKPNWATIVSVLSACAHCGALERGKHVHMYIEKNKMKVDSIIGTALIDMYAKCGCIESAFGVFDALTPKDVFSWTAMIGGLAVNGHGAVALELFGRMEKSGVRPNGITFLGVLSACSHGGWVQLTKHYFDLMRKVYGIEPQVEHYGCMIDAFGRAGHLEEAVSFIEAMPVKTNDVSWLTLLGACSFYGNAEIGEYVVRRLAELKPDDGGVFVLLSNIYAMKGRWDDARNARLMMEAKGLRKCPGRSSIEVCNVVHEFYAGDKSHPRIQDIYNILDEIASRLKLVGYAPTISPVFYDIEEEEKEHAVFHHSEKLAIAFGLISIDAGMPVRVFKNLRVCYDCHTFAKLVSREFRRDIIMRDRTVFHYFRDGSCSCRDYW